jgi:hypothetical protein
MSAVDAPPGLAFAGQAAGEFVARPRARRLAGRVFLFCTVAGMTTLALGARRLHTPLIELLLIAPLICMSVAAVGFAVRSAHLRVDHDGVRWGWRWAGFRLGRDRLVRVDAYRDAFALKPKRGSTWYLSRRDWDNFDRVAQAMRAAGIEFTRHDRKAPIGARLQSYGGVLDTLLVLDALAALLALLAALVV